MYDLLDRPVDRLCAFDRAVLERTRRWVYALTLAGHDRLPPTDDPFDLAMRALDRGSGDLLVIQRPCHATVGDTEAVLLGLWRLVATDRLAIAHAVALGLVSADHAAPLLDGMIRAAAAFGE